MTWRPSGDRERDAERARELYKQLGSVTQVAREMDIPRSTASDYINHPQSGELYRTRARQFAICPSCGGRMSYGAEQCNRCIRSK